MGEQFEKFVAESVKRIGQSAGQLAQEGVKLSRIGGVDHAQDGFGLREIDSAGEKGSQGEFARLGQSGAGRAKRFQQRL
jgi:hypothetical protein